MCRCFNKEACTGEEEKLDKLQNCATSKGYEGLFCASCSREHWKNPGTFNCYECDEKDTFKQLMYKVLLLIVFIVIVSIIIKIFWNTKDEQNVEIVALLRILITFFHMMTILARA